MAEKIATREAYGRALAEFGAKYPQLVVFDADLAQATKTVYFKEKYPERHFDCGIAEGGHQRAFRRPAGPHSGRCRGHTGDLYSGNPGISR